MVRSKTTPREVNEVLTRSSSLIGLCELPPSYFRGSAPRTGAGPAPVWLYHQQSGGSPGRARIELGSLPDSAHLTWKEQDARRVQLVGCTGIDKDDNWATGRTCTYAGRSVPLRTGKYLLELRAAATGHVIASGKVVPASRQCPAEEGYITPSAEEYADAFEQLAKEAAG
ncbi:hypothetical protein ACFP1Z_13370 [Streptomyces gamaensis]|uniref:Uncharacterized protein n=1 Tax=Streptomyces gamaensis TaxID=1763542 RepID=A0ABW0YX92_9ACTN